MEFPHIFYSKFTSKSTHNSEPLSRFNFNWIKHNILESQRYLSHLIIPYGVKIIQSVCSGGIYCRTVCFMAESNHSAVTEFILLGLTDNPELQLIFFCVLLLIYLITVLGNFGLIVLIQVSPQLHTPMYFFLCHLAFVDFYGSSTITPNTLVNTFCEIKSVSFYACAT